MPDVLSVTELAELKHQRDMSDIKPLTHVTHQPVAVVVRDFHSQSIIHCVSKNSGPL